MAHGRDESALVAEGPALRYPSGSMASPVTLMPEVEAERWASELEAFAQERERRVDLRAARTAREARELAASIRDVGREIKDARLSDDTTLTGILLENLGSLRSRALAILKGTSPRKPET
jgi:hypothetical protein